MNKELLTKLKQKKKAYKVEATRDTLRGTQRHCLSSQVRKAKARLELHFSRNVKGNKKGYYRYVSDKRKIREIVASLQKEVADLLTSVMGKAEAMTFLPQSSQIRSPDT